MRHIMLHWSVSISLRNLSPDVEKAILEISRRERISLNKATLRLLESSIRKPAVNSDFEEFFGTWPSQEADSFEETVRKMRQVDPLDWKAASG